jgi:hypothetical protein
MAPVRTVKASPLSNAKVIKRVTLVARAIAKNGRTAKTSRKIKVPVISQFRSSVGTTNKFQGRDDNAVRLEESLKEDVNLLAQYLMRRFESKSSVGEVA